MKVPYCTKQVMIGGRIHDYEIFKNKHPTTPPQVENILDLGYMGVKNDFPTVKYVLPFRKKRKKNELTDGEKRHNRKHSKLRIIVEHTVSRIKKFGIMGIKFRNRLGRYDHASDIVSGLVNFRIMMRTNEHVILKPDRSGFTIVKRFSFVITQYIYIYCKKRNYIRVETQLSAIIYFQKLMQMLISNQL